MAFGVGLQWRVDDVDRPLARLVGHGLEQCLDVRSPSCVLLEEHIFRNVFDP